MIAKPHAILLITHSFLEKILGIVKLENSKVIVQSSISKLKDHIWACIYVRSSVSRLEIDSTSSKLVMLTENMGWKLENTTNTLFLPTPLTCLVKNLVKTHNLALA